MQNAKWKVIVDDGIDVANWIILSYHNTEEEARNFWREKERKNTNPLQVVPIEDERGEKKTFMESLMAILHS